MEVECATGWSSICEESEIIAHLQAVFWGTSDLDVDPNLPSSNTCSDVDHESFCTGATLNITPNVGFDCHLDNLGSENRAMVGSKRKIQSDEFMINGEEDFAVPAVSEFVY